MRNGTDHDKLKAGDPKPFKEPFDTELSRPILLPKALTRPVAGFIPCMPLPSLLFDSVAYKTCVSNGLVLDKNGNKMSKRLGNVVIRLKPSKNLAPMPPAGT